MTGSMDHFRVGDTSEFVVTSLRVVKTVFDCKGLLLDGRHTSELDGVLVKGILEGEQKCGGQNALSNLWSDACMLISIP
jgi:hypothetical protein